MTYPDIADALLPRISSMSVLKICLTIARQTGCGNEEVRLTVSDLAELTGMIKQSILNGLEGALEQGWISRKPIGNSFWYKFETKNLDQVGKEIRPKRYKNETETVQNLDPQPSKNHTVLSQNLDRFEKPSLLPELKAASSARASEAETKTDAWRFWESLVGRRPLEKFKQLRENHVAWFERYKAHHLTVAKGEAQELAAKRKKDWIYILADLCENPGNSRALEGFAHMTAAPPSPPEPDENGIILGEIYWHREQRHKVRPVGYRPDWGEYSVEVPIAGVGDPVRGRFESAPPALLEPLGQACAA